jgi:hypothetical protein
MDSCRACGARLAPAIGWCGQCFAPVAPPAAPVGAGLPRRPGMVAPPPEPRVVEYSRFKAGATSMGWFGRSLSTIGVLIVAAFVYLYAFPVMVGVNDYRTRTLYLTVASPVIIYVLSRVWRTTRIH